MSYQKSRVTPDFVPLYVVTQWSLSKVNSSHSDWNNICENHLFVCTFVFCHWVEGGIRPIFQISSRYLSFPSLHNLSLVVLVSSTKCLPNWKQHLGWLDFVFLCPDTLAWSRPGEAVVTRSCLDGERKLCRQLWRSRKLMFRVTLTPLSHGRSRGGTPRRGVVGFTPLSWVSVRRWSVHSADVLYKTILTWMNA